MDYHEYLKSDEWQKKRSERLKIDGFKCQICGRPMDLQVHHLTYANIYNENVYTDLITLCKYCHEQIEKRKQEFNTGKRRAWLDQRNIEMDFCHELAEQDYSHGGKLNLTNRDVIREEWETWLIKKGLPQMKCRVLTVTEFFRNERIKLIMRMEDSGALPSDIAARGISYSMIKKYYGNRKFAETIINRPIF